MNRITEIKLKTGDYDYTHSQVDMRDMCSLIRRVDDLENALKLIISTAETGDAEICRQVAIKLAKHYLDQETI